MKEYKIMFCNISNQTTIAAAETSLNVLAKDGWQVFTVNINPQNGAVLIYTLERYVAKN